MAPEKDKEVDVKELEKLPLDERLKKLKEILSSKKKEMGDIESLFNKTIREKAESEEAGEEIPPEDAETQTRSIDGFVEEPQTETEKTEKRFDINEISSMYERLHNYSELAQKGGMDYNSFNTARELYNQLNSIRNEIENQYASSQYKPFEEIDNMANSSKRLFKEIFSQYSSIVKTYKDNNAP